MIYRPLKLLLFTIIIPFFIASSHDLVVAGPLSFADGTGRITYSLLDQLSQSLDVAYYCQDAFFKHTLIDDPYQLQSRLQLTDNLDNHKIFLCTDGLPGLETSDYYKKVPKKTVRIIYSAFESTELPQFAVKIFNEYFDKVVVPDDFLVEVYKKSGVIIPVIVAPMGLYLKPFFLKKHNKYLKGQKPFVFSCVATRHVRKNIKKLIQAFAAVFGNNTDYLLKIQLKPGVIDFVSEVNAFSHYLFNENDQNLEKSADLPVQEEFIEDVIRELKVNNIQLFTDVMNEQEYVDFIASSDCYVLISTGEGFSNTPREAMAAGVPVILSNNTAHRTLVNSGYVLPVESSKAIDAWYEAFTKPIVAGKQFDCTQYAVEEALQEMVIHYDKYYDKAKEGRDWVLQYDWSVAKSLVEALYAPVDLKKHVMISGASGFCDGLGRIGYGIIDQLGDYLSISYYRTKKQDTSYADYLNFDDPYQIKSKLIQNGNYTEKTIFFHLDSIQYFMRDEFYQKLPSSMIKYIYSMFESTSIPKQAVDKINNYFDAVIVPDPFHIQVYKESGVVKPIFCIPTGLYLQKFFNRPLSLAIHKPFTFMCIAARSPRKNLIKLIDSFCETFGNDSAYILKIHVKPHAIGAAVEKSYIDHVENMTEEDLEDLIECVAENNLSIEEYIQQKGVSNIEVSTVMFNEEQYIDYMATADCYVLVSLGEGFSNTPREAMALGVPTIVSDNTAQSTIVSSGFGIGVPCKNIIPAVYDGIKKTMRTGFHFDCTIEDLKIAFLNMVNNYAFYKAQAVGARNWVRQYDWPQFKKDYFTLFNPQKVILSSEDRIDGVTGTIMTTDKTFYQKWKFRGVNL